MATVDELAIAYVQVLSMVAPAPPLTLMNQDADQAAAIIGAIVDRAAEVGLKLVEVVIGVELSVELGLSDNCRLKHGGKPLIRVDPDLGRQIIFRL